MPAPGEHSPLPPPRRPHRYSGELLSLPTPAPAEEEEDGEKSSAVAWPAETVAPAEVEPDLWPAAPSLVPEVRRRRRPHGHLGANRPWRWNVSPVLLGFVLFLAVVGGGALSWVLGLSWPVIVRQMGPERASAPTAAPEPAFPEAAKKGAADPAEAVEAAYEAMEAGRPLEARDRFLTLAAAADPTTRSGSTLRAAAAWCELAAGRTEAAEGLLVAGLGRVGGGDSAEGRFLLGFSRLLRGEHAEAEKSFARAAALDPTRADVHLLWGDTLRREGRPRESIAHFRAALRRNRQETNFGFYRLKLWISQLQAGGENATEAAAAINTALQAGDPPDHMALLGGAAYAVVAGQWTEVARYLRQARLGMEPAVFAVALQDSLFSEQAARPELAEFFPPAQVPR